MKADISIAGSYNKTEKLKQNLYVISYYLIAFVLLASGISKILNPKNLLNTLNITLTFLGENIIILIATALPVIEVALGIMLLLKIKVKETLFTTVILFTVFLLFAIYGFISGFDIDCGCFGSSLSSEFGAGMIIRNITLLLIGINVYTYREKFGLKRSLTINNN